ncbi:hypothetical protein CSOJ01_12662 [Colletotrichum sojae]|uniref:LITAF domain-containing protein n=1 Tax=Colletotrichum sojae TaxID=2175907 RepID=A0A8H6IV05_9PEZI|nr:hypothetical protein CSOJ01_12662 [Colletotrichum sojae]
MSQPLTVESPNTEFQQPAPVHDTESIATTMQGTGPAPTKDMPASLIQDENITSPPPTYQKAGPTITPLPAADAVTPLQMLGDKPQLIDCPFCQKRTMTDISKEGTSMQMVVGALCCLFCICLTCVPCIAGWFEDIHYSCGHCHQRVATRPYNGTIQVFGPHATGPVASQYEPAPPPVAEKQNNNNSQQQ